LEQHFGSNSPSLEDVGHAMQNDQQKTAATAFAAAVQCHQSHTRPTDGRTRALIWTVSETMVQAPDDALQYLLPLYLTNPPNFSQFPSL
jgi:hypothetical protein